MNAQVTEAHKQLAREIMFGSSPEAASTLAHHVAQLIADSEALACAELRAEIADQVARFHEEIARRQQVVQDNKALDLQERDQLRAEIAQLQKNCTDIYDAGRKTEDQLRAEVERLKRDYDYDHKCLYEVRERCELWKQRAERAEAEMERLKPYVSKAVLTHEGTMLCSPLVAVKFNEQTARAESAEREVERLREWQAGVIANERLHHAERKEAIARAESAEAELAGIRALADRRNKRDHSQDTTHQLVAALDQALDIAQAELAATKSTLDEEVNCAEKAEHEVVRQYARAERAEADLATAKAIIASIEEDGTEEHNAAVRLRQELATERAKYNQLLSALVYADQILDDIDTCSDAHKPMYSSYSQNVFKLCIKGRDARRAAIDGAIKEGSA